MSLNAKDRVTNWQTTIRLPIGVIVITSDDRAGRKYTTLIARKRVGAERHTIAVAIYERDNAEDHTRAVSKIHSSIAALGKALEAETTGARLLA